jgi:gamma-glutamyltranspeptidase/glutathione hydrolase
MASTAHPLATQAAHSVLKLGGSAVDAAIAAQLVLGLTEPESSGIGGGAFLLHWSEADKRLRTYDGRETAPGAVTSNLFLDHEKKPIPLMDAIVGGRSVGVPGVLRMLALAHQRHGRLRWAELFQYAIFAAEEGFVVSDRLAAALARERFLPEDPEASKVFYPRGAPVPAGSRITNRAYGETLRRIAMEGANAFYRGPIAADMVRAVRSHRSSGSLSEEDLAAYRALEREPVCGPFRRWRICSMGPPSSGGVGVLQMLGLLENAAIERAPSYSVEAAHLFAEAGKLAYADRLRYLGDPAFARIPLARLLHPLYLETRARLIGERASGAAAPGDMEGGTSHLSVVDAEGNVVALTTTIESTFGSRIMVRGFLLNNQLTDFDFLPGTNNHPAPGKRPRSSMAPTIVFSTGSAQLALGSPGGSSIINYVAKTLLARLEWGVALQEALDAPNFGSRNGPLELERGTPYERLAPLLRARGHDVVLREMTSGVHAIERFPGGWRGAADPRREGMALGD